MRPGFKMKKKDRHWQIRTPDRPAHSKATISRSCLFARETRLPLHRHSGRKILGNFMKICSEISSLFKIGEKKDTSHKFLYLCDLSPWFVIIIRTDPDPCEVSEETWSEFECGQISLYGKYDLRPKNWAVHRRLWSRQTAFAANYKLRMKKYFTVEHQA
jgi:hypothetical protein